MSFLLKRKISPVLISGYVLLVLLLFPFARDVVYNESLIASLEERTKKYSHPLDSQLLQRFSIIGNFAPASNQCGFIVAEVRTTMLEPNNIYRFYAPILTAPFSSGNPPYHEVILYNLSDEKGVENITRLYPEVYERIIYRALNDTHVYLLITAETGYQPNNDPRCH